MSDNKNYYYLKLKEDFFNSEDMKLMQSLPDGYLFSDIYLKLCLMSLKNDGKLLYRDRMPYNSRMIATLTGHQVSVVEQAFQTFKDLGFIEVLPNGAMYINDIQNYVGTSSTEADRKRAYRAKIAQESKKALIDSDNSSGKDKKSENKDICPDTSQDICPDVRPQRLENRDKSIEIRDKSLENREQSIDNSLIVSKDTIRQTDVRRILEEWNTLSEYGIPQVTKLTPSSKRGKCLTARIKEYGVDTIIQGIDMIRQSDFLQGKTTDFVITFDWFVKPSNFPKVLEGNYTRRNTNQGSNQGYNDYIDMWRDA